jgi:uracil-DNA glycosylase
MDSYLLRKWYNLINFPSNNWSPIFQQAQELGLFQKVIAKLDLDRAEGKTIFPTENDFFRAFDLCDFDKLKVVLLGQDPYHGSGEANGLCFSVHKGIRMPPSLRNIFKELKQEYTDFNEKRTSDLSDWAEQGVLLVNSVLTVEKDLPASHAKYGWQLFTDFVISEISNKKEGIVFILLGNFAQTKIPLIQTPKHKIISAAHPSPFSAHRGFFGSEVFKICNAYLKTNGENEIVW